MKSYETLKKVSNELYLNLENVNDVKVRLKESVQIIHSQISVDFESLFGLSLNLEDYHIYFDDEYYRQSATGLILNETILNNDEFKIQIECLVDIERILLKITKGKEISDFLEIVYRIEKNQNIEGLSELKEIK